MAGRREQLRGAAKMIVSLGRSVAQEMGRAVAKRLAGRIREGVDLEANIPSRPTAEAPADGGRGSRLVVTAPDGTPVEQGRHGAGGASSPVTPESGGGAPQAEAAATPVAPARDYRLFERVRVRRDGVSWVGEVYEIQPSERPSYDVLTYGDDGVPRVLKGLEAVDLSLAE